MITVVAEVVAVARPRPRGRRVLAPAVRRRAEMVQRTLAAHVSHARRSSPGGKRLQNTRRKVTHAARRIAASSLGAAWAAQTRCASGGISGLNQQQYAARSY